MTELYLDQLEVERIDHENDDLTVVNAARVSNSKRVARLVTKASPKEARDERALQDIGLDDGLTSYLARNNHWTPFAHARFGFAYVLPLDFDWTAFLNWAGVERRSAGFVWRCEGHEDGVIVRMWGSLYGWMTANVPLPGPILGAIHDVIADQCPLSYAALVPGDLPQFEDIGEVARLDSDSITFRIQAPLVIFRQLMRSNLGIVYNETSRRYVDDEPTIFEPPVWRSRPPKSIKQGSGDPLEEMVQHRIDERVSLHNRHGVELYEDLLELGVAPEQARFPLPQTMNSELWMTATHDAIRRIMGLRLGKDGKNHPQAEIVALAEALAKLCPELTS